MQPRGPRLVLASQARRQVMSPGGVSSVRSNGSLVAATPRRVLSFQTAARPSVTPARRGQHPARHLFELPPKHFELSDLILDGGELLSNQREELRTERRA